MGRIQPLGQEIGIGRIVPQQDVNAPLGQRGQALLPGWHIGGLGQHRGQGSGGEVKVLGQILPAKAHELAHGARIL